MASANEKSEKKKKKYPSILEFEREVAAGDSFCMSMRLASKVFLLYMPTTGMRQTKMDWTEPRMRWISDFCARAILFMVRAYPADEGVIARSWYTWTGQLRRAYIGCRRFSAFATLRLGIFTAPRGVAGPRTEDVYAIAPTAFGNYIALFSSDV